MYERFDELDGSHPWRDVSPNGYIDYPACRRKGGRVVYFNYDLAKELELIPKDHGHTMNADLEEAVLRTFSIRILNEHDWANRAHFPRDGMEDHIYMATRYLQSQHDDKMGRTSGDGRSIWNGRIRTRKMTFDISSCGTGNTVLSPGSQEHGETLPTGSTEYGYATGLADLEEMLGSAVMSEIFYREGFPTERCLTVIGFKNDTAIGVRSAPNLIRPAHLFRYLKSSDLEDLKKSFDYFLSRQIENGVWDISETGPRYGMALRYLAQTYAKLSAVMEEEYIFNWLAWDGDNILADGSILDYGSIRQFAAKHNKYRYEDVDRFSTCLSEQRYWARYMIQTFAQMIDYLRNGVKRPLEEFREDPVLGDFDEEFERQRHIRMLWRIGFDEQRIGHLMRYHRPVVETFRKVLNYFEHVKTKRGEEVVPDGINHPPVFLVRHILRILPGYLLKNNADPDVPVFPPEEFCLEMAATYVDSEDLVLTEHRRHKALQFQKMYRELVVAADEDNVGATLKVLRARSGVINYEHRKTGDGLTWIVREALEHRDQMNRNQLQEAIERFVGSQVLVPGKWKPIQAGDLKGNSLRASLLRRMQENLELYNEHI